MERVIAVARECGYLDGVPPFLGPDAFERLPRDRILALATGSQGEPRAALARIAEDEHPVATLSAGDTVIFSSRTIPGNEKAVGKLINGSGRAGVEVVTDRNALVHVSGHPRRGELAQMYAWLRPKIAVPAHGEALHLSEHAAFAKAQQRAAGRARLQRRYRSLRPRRRGDHRQDRAGQAASRTARSFCRPIRTASPSGAGFPSPASSRSRSR